MAPRLQTFSTYHLLQNSLVKRLWAVYMTFMSMFWHFVTSFLMKNNFRYLMMKVFRDGWLSENLSLSAIENKRKSHLCLTRLKKIFSFSLKACGSAAIIKHSHGLLTIRVETRAKKNKRKTKNSIIKTFLYSSFSFNERKVGLIFHGIMLHKTQRLHPKLKVFFLQFLFFNKLRSSLSYFIINTLSAFQRRKKTNFLSRFLSFTFKVRVNIKQWSQLNVDELPATSSINFVASILRRKHFLFIFTFMRNAFKTFLFTILMINLRKC